MLAVAADGEGVCRDFGNQMVRAMLLKENILPKGENPTLLTPLSGLLVSNFLFCRG